jgi:hypothetical protein
VTAPLEFLQSYKIAQEHPRLYGLGKSPAHDMESRLAGKTGPAESAVPVSETVESPESEVDPRISGAKVVRIIIWVIIRTGIGRIRSELP